MLLGTNLTSPRRLQALAETCLVDSPPEESFDRYTRLCSALLDVPVALVVLVESNRLFFKSRSLRKPIPGFQQSGSVSQSFCQHVVIHQQAFVVDDCRCDDRTKESPAVTRYHIRAYAGLPIRTPEGEVLGSFCAIDFQPRAWTEPELAHLSDLRHGIESEIALRLQLFRLDKTSAELHRHLHASQQLFLNLGHEVRTPLNAIVNLTQACLEEPLPAPAAELAETVLHNAKRLSQLLEGVLDLAALEAGQVASKATATEMEPLLSTCRVMVASLSRPDLALETTIDADMPPWLSIDGVRLSQLLAILVQYHLGRCAWKGKLHLQTAWSAPDHVEIRLSCDSYRMEPDELSALFSYNPSGVEARSLSPAIICSLVDLLAARLWATSNEEAICFHLRVPVGPAVPPAPRPAPAERPLKILAVDDDATNLKVLTYLVDKLGHDLTSCVSGADGLRRLTEQSFDILLLDLRMPEMDGFEVAHKIRQGGLKLPIVAITADASESARQRAQAAGIDAFMTKPVKRGELSSMLESLVLNAG